MPMQIVHDDAVPGHPLHLPEKAAGRVAVEVVQKECGMSNVDRVVVAGESKGVLDLHANL
jgi:hypothetical protein